MSIRNYKIGNEFLPYHPSVSDIHPDFRDGWNACYSGAQLRITELESQLADAQKDAKKWRLLMSGDILIPASERLPEHTIVLMRATTDHFGGVISAVADEDEYFDKLLIDTAMQPKETT